MQPPLLPPDELERLASLRALDILDTTAEERFDRITRIAKALFDVPIALVSLVDENRQWFKSRQGLTACETSRDVSFCGHAILANGPLWVEDAFEDERFHDNPLVSGAPHIRFYAGVPLRGQEGHRLGTLCVIDTEPRRRDMRGQELLCDLARIAEAELGNVQLGRSQTAALEPEDRTDRIDAVTGVWNRAGILEVLDLGLEFCAMKGWPATALLAEIDERSELCDTWTAQGSDLILAEVAQVLRGCVRGFDSIGRTCDNQFLILLAGLSAEDAGRRVARLQSRLDENPVLLSIGVRMHLAYSSVVAQDEPAEGDRLLREVFGALERVRHAESVAA